MCFVLAALFYVTPCRAQWNQFEKIWNPVWGNSDRGMDVIATSNGYTMLTLTRNLSFNLDPIISLVHMDLNGTPLWTKYYCGTTGSSGRLLRTSDGGYVICAGVRDSVGTPGSIGLIKTDSVGNVQWANAYKSA